MPGPPPPARAMPRQHGRTALIEACTGGHVGAAQLLLERRADVFAADKVRVFAADKVRAGPSDSAHNVSNLKAAGGHEEGSFPGPFCSVSPFRLSFCLSDLSVSPPLSLTSLPTPLSPFLRDRVHRVIVPSPHTQD